MQTGKGRSASGIRSRSFLIKAILPVAGLALTVALIAQAGGLRGKPSARQEAGVVAGAPHADETLDRVAAEGRIVAYPGAQVDVGTEVKGMLGRVLVEEKQAVRKGQLLAELRNDDLKAQIVEADARVSEAEADTRLYETELARMEALIAQSVESQQSLDNAKRNYDAALARRAVAEAVVRRLEAELAKTRIVSPIDGVLISRDVQPGETVDAGLRLFTVADLTRMRIEAEVDEFDAGHVAVGSSVTITAEGFDGRTWRGVVEEVPDQVVTRKLRPQDPGRPGDTRVLLVKIAIADPAPLRLGQRVEVGIEAREAQGA